MVEVKKDSQNPTPLPSGTQPVNGSPETNTLENPDTTPYKPWLGNDPTDCGSNP